MKAKLPRSVKFDAATEARLARLLEKMDTGGSGIKFPTVVNMAITHLLDQLDGGANIIFDGTRIRLVNVEVPTVTPKKTPAVVELEKPAPTEASTKKRNAS